MSDTDTQRCEPPGRLRCVDGWYWLNLTNNPDEIWRWDEQCRAWGNANSVRASSIQMASYGYRYVAPATPPATVAALVEALEWMIANDDTNEGDAPMPELGGQTWDEFNSYWINGLNRARAALAAYRGEAGR